MAKQIASGHQTKKKYTPEIKEKALALLATTDNVEEVSRKTGIPVSTLKTWKKDSGEDFAELRRKKKEQFIESAWQLIDDSLEVAKTRMSRARNLENGIDELIKAIQENQRDIMVEKGLRWSQLLDVIHDLRAIKAPKLSEISTLIGTIYDKQALANGEATSREEQVIKGFEDY